MRRNVCKRQVEELPDAKPQLKTVKFFQKPKSGGSLKSTAKLPMTKTGNSKDSLIV